MKKLFTKSLMAVGVAGLMGLTSVAMAAEFDWSGSIRAGYTSVDSGGADSNRVETVGANKGSRIGINASTDLGNGQSAGAELSYNVGGDLTTRRQNVFLSGGWGKLTLGQHGGIYRSAANWDQSSYLGGNVRFEGAAGDGLAGGDTGLVYASNIAGPFSFDIEIASSAPVAAVACKRSVDQAFAVKEVNYVPPTGIKGVPATPATPAVGIPCERNSTPAKDAVEEIVAVDYVPPTGIKGVEYKPRVDGVAAVEGVDGKAIGRWAATAHYAFSDAATLNLGYHDSGSTYNNTVVSVNGSAGGFGYYVAYETSKDTVGDDDANTVGLFLSYDAGDNRVYLEYENASVDNVDNDPQATLVGYRRDLGAGVDFTAEYVTVKPADSKTLNLVLKYDF